MACQRKVCLGIVASMLPRDDVLNMKRHSLRTLREETILAAMVRALDNPPAQGSVHLAALLLRKPGSRLGLKHRDEVKSLNVHLVLAAFALGQLSLITFFRELCNSRLSGGACLDLYEGFRDVPRQRSGYRFKHLVKNGC
jgi:hypothetical protein